MSTRVSAFLQKREYILLFYTAFLFFFLEVVLFAGLRFATFYFQAQLVIALSLLGLVVGGIFATLLKRELIQKVSKGVVLSLSLTPLLGFGGIIFGLSHFWLSTLLLGFTFVPIGFLIGSLYRTLDPWYAYAVELFGGLAGLAGALILLPILREENALLVAVFLSAVFFGVYYRRTLSEHFKVILFFSSLLIIVFVGANLKYEYVNLVNIVLCRLPTGEEASIPKITCFKNAGYNYTVIRSLGSIVDRIDIVALQTAEGTLLGTSFSGSQIDIIQPFSPSAYRADARIPSVVFNTGKTLDTLIIGAGAEGVVKVVKAGGVENITAVDLNPTILKLWREDEELRRYARDPFAGVNLIRADGRAYLETHEKQFDLITMMNTHRTRNLGEFGQPDFLHTKEAFRLLWRHIDDDGFLIFEEPNFTMTTTAAIERVTHTLREALKSEGVINPAEHVVIYEWNSAIARGVTDQSFAQTYVQFVVKKTPWNNKELRALQVWGHEASQTDNRTMPINALFQQWLWIPSEEKVADSNLSVLAGIITGTQLSTASVLTDTNPFPISATAAHNTILIRALVAFSFMFFLAAFWWYRQTKRYTLYARLSLPFYFVLIGVGYMFIEIILIQWFQLYLGSVMLSFASAIGGLFIASALGSVLIRTKNISSRQFLFGAPMVLFVLAWLLFYAMQVSYPDTLSVRFIITFAIALVAGLALGIFFPYGIHHARTGLGQKIPFLVGLNGSAMALGVPLSFVIVSVWGLPTLFFVAGICYVVALTLIKKTKYDSTTLNNSNMLK